MGGKVDFIRKKYAPLKDKTLHNALAHRIGQEFPRIGGGNEAIYCFSLGSFCMHHWGCDNTE